MMSDPPRLFLVTPPVADAGAFAPFLEAALDAADVASVLLRVAATEDRMIEAVSRALAPLVQDRGAALLLEGDARRAARLGADGIHVWGVGNDFDGALRSLKPDRIVGVGGLRTRDDAMRAGEAGADYLMFGGPGPHDDDAALEDTTWWAEIFNVPCVAYVRDPAKADEFVRAGADFLAFGDELWAEPARVGRVLRAVSAAMISAESSA